MLCRQCLHWRHESTEKLLKICHWALGHGVVVAFEPAAPTVPAAEYAAASIVSIDTVPTSGATSVVPLAAADVASAVFKPLPALWWLVSGGAYHYWYLVLWGI